VFVWSQRWEEVSPSGFPRLGAHRRRFLVESLSDLSVSLRSLNIPLIITSKPEETLRKLGAITSFHYNLIPASEEQNEAAEIVKTARSLGAEVRPNLGFSLVHPADLPFQLPQLPDLFTSFRKEVERNFHVRSPLSVPNPQAWPDLSIESEDLPTVDLGAGRFPGGENAALARLQHYFFESDRLRVYKETRNGMLEDDDSSKLSPYLAHGCLSPRTIYDEVKRYERERVANDSTYWLIFELLWRDFFHFTLAKHGNRLFHVGGLQDLPIRWSNHEPFVKAWTGGQTGFPLVDAAMRELAATGYMSNRSRQIVASFLTKNLGLDWRIGAEWFESQLVDYEVGANWGNWQYAAGVGNDAREFRLFNLKRQAEQYDPAGHFVQAWAPDSKALKPILDFDVSARENRQKYEHAVSAMRSGRAHTNSGAILDQPGKIRRSRRA